MVPGTGYEFNRHVTDDDRAGSLDRTGGAGGFPDVGNHDGRHDVAERGANDPALCGDPAATQTATASPDLRNAIFARLPGDLVFV